MPTLIRETPIFDEVHAQYADELPILPVPVETHQDFLLRMDFPGWLHDAEHGISKVGGRTKKTAKKRN